MIYGPTSTQALEVLWCTGAEFSFKSLSCRCLRAFLIDGFAMRKGKPWSQTQSTGNEGRLKNTDLSATELKRTPSAVKHL